MNDSFSTDFLCCPECKGSLSFIEVELNCVICGKKFSVVDGIPILLRKDNELFDDESVKSISSSGFREGLLSRVSKRLPSYGPSDGFEKLLKRSLLIGGSRIRCLVVGAGDNSRDLEVVRASFSELIAVDVCFSDCTTHVCDAHDLPFKDGSFDFVILNAVLEHVLDAQRVVEEVSRVLSVGGVVVSSVPFMQPVHMGAFDFVRFSDLGHRWLFRCFSEIERGPIGGAGSALCWSLSYFFASFFRVRFLAALAKVAVRVSFFWLKYFDRLAGPGGYDALAGSYFVGRKSRDRDLSPSELVRLYRGLDK